MQIYADLHAAHGKIQARLQAEQFKVGASPSNTRTSTHSYREVNSSFPTISPAKGHELFSSMGGLGHIPAAVSHPPSEHLPGLCQSRGEAGRGGRSECNVHLLITDIIVFVFNLDSC